MVVKMNEQNDLKFWLSSELYFFLDIGSYIEILVNVMQTWVILCFELWWQTACIVV